MTDNNYDVKDLSLATKGRFKIEWAKQEMPVLRLERVGTIAWEVYMPLILNVAFALNRQGPRLIGLSAGFAPRKPGPQIKGRPN
jgi:hypothetical protein